MSDDCVVKRNEKREPFSFDKILARVKKLGKGELCVNDTALVQKIIDRLYDGIPTSYIDELTAQQCASLITTHQDYGILASRIMISNHHKNTSASFKQVIEELYMFKDVHGIHHPLIAKEMWELVMENTEKIEKMIDYERDYYIDFFGFKTLERAYLMKVNGIIKERPQHMWMRVALSIHKNNWEKVKITYDAMSNKFFTHATPTLFNAGTPRPQLSSCYLLAMKDDSIEGIYETLTDCAKISKWAGGIGLHVHNIRAAGTHIRGTNGTSNGLVPMLRVYNNTARYVDQCIIPETYIYTTSGPKEIQFCEAGKTAIFTTNGVEIIENVLEHPYEGKVITINGTHSFTPLTITPEHPVYCLTNQLKGINYKIIQNRLKKNLIRPEWIEAKNITKNDMLIFPIPSYEKDNIKVDKDDCYIYGLLLGDGCMSNQSTTCYISLHSTNKSQNLEFIKNYLTKKCIQYYITQENNTTRIRWNKAMELPFRYALLYNEQKEKYLHPNWINLPLEKAKYIVKGLIDSDGCIANEITFDTTSRQLIEALRYILLRMGIPTGGYIRNRIGEKHTSRYGDIIENKKISYCLRIPKTDELTQLLSTKKGSFTKFFTYNNMIYTRITDITKNHYNGTLYDLQMKKTHNYMIHNGIIHNGGGKRNGSFAIYLEPWHADIYDFLEMKKTHGDEEARARDLFYALWIPDLFMKRVSSGADWTLMCPDKCPGLSDVYGEEFNTLYEKYEQEGRGKPVKARDLWFKILDSQIETGTPYMLYKDACNTKSNQKNLGTIKSSNLCTEIIEYSNEEETAVCNLASIGLAKFVVQPISPFTEKVRLYSKSNCTYCKMAKNLLNRLNISFEEVCMEDIAKRKEIYRKFSEKSGKSIHSVPIITHDNVYIGGYMELAKQLQPTFDYENLHQMTKIVTENLNKVIDINYYPTEKTRRSNYRHRPIGIGVQGLADTFALMNIPFHSEEARDINKKIFETMYHAALEQSNEIAKERLKGMTLLKQYYSFWKGHNEGETHRRQYRSVVHPDKNIIETIHDALERYQPIPDEINNLSGDRYGAYSSFVGSPASEGILQFDMWNVTPSKRYDWDTLRHNIKQYGMRNSLLLAPMPTASTSQILGNNECFEPFTSNIYVRRTIAGEFIVANKYMMTELTRLDLWNDDIKNSIIANQGSIQHLHHIPASIRQKYKIVWEIPMKHILTMAKERGVFIDQSQSQNLWMKDPTYDKLTAMHFFAWKCGLKTGIYYLRTKAKAAPQQFTIDPSNKSSSVQEENDCEMCSG